MADNMPTPEGQPEVVSTVSRFLKRVKKRQGGMNLDTSLYAEGLGLDSLEIAELSAALEDELGDDPFTSGEELPETIGDIVAYYEDQ